MPPVRTNKRPASPAEASPSSLTYASTLALGTDPSSASVLRLNSLSLSPTSPETDASLSPSVTKKKRSHGKARPPGHIRRPPNAFIIFRTEYIKSQSTHSTPEVSRNLGAMWRGMSKEEKQPWNDRADEAKAQHQRDNPGYKYKPVHPRDAQGNCIRKPRKPNQHRANNTAGDVLEHFPLSFPWMEAKCHGEFPNTCLPSDASSASSPPRSPSPAASLYVPESQPSYQSFRRSSSVPIPNPDDRFFFGTAPTGSTYPPSPSGPHTGHVSRRLSKRPSTSMDFACAGPIHPELYSANTDLYLSPGDSAQWRPGHRRSISAPGFGGDIPTAQFAYTPSHCFAPEANPLTPINPVFGNVFDKFSWSAPASSQHHQNGMPPTHPYISLDIPVPSMSNSPTSNFSSATTHSASTPGGLPSPQVCTPATMEHPTPMSSFDFSAFQAQIREFDAAAFEHAPHADGGFGRIAQGGLGNALGLVAQPYADQPRQGYPTNGANEQQFYPAEAMQGHAGDVAQPYAREAQLPAAHAEASTADIRGYDEGIRYTRPEMAPPQALDFHQLIVEGY